MKKLKNITKQYLNRVRVHPLYDSYWYSKFINKFMIQGKKQVVEKIITRTFFKLKRKFNSSPLTLLFFSLQKLKPFLSLVQKRFGRNIKKVPIPLQPRRQLVIALKWFVNQIRVESEWNFDNKLWITFYNLFKTKNRLKKTKKKMNPLKKIKYLKSKKLHRIKNFPPFRHIKLDKKIHIITRFSQIKLNNKKINLKKKNQLKSLNFLRKFVHYFYANKIKKPKILRKFKKSKQAKKLKKNKKRIISKKQKLVYKSSIKAQSAKLLKEQNKYKWKKMYKRLRKRLNNLSYKLQKKVNRRSPLIRKKNALYFDITRNRLNSRFRWI